MRFRLTLTPQLLAKCNGPRVCTDRSFGVRTRNVPLLNAKNCTASQTSRGTTRRRDPRASPNMLEMQVHQINKSY